MRTQGRVTLLASLTLVLLTGVAAAQDEPAIERVQGVKKLSPWEKIVAKAPDAAMVEPALAIAERIERMPVEVRVAAPDATQVPVDPLPEAIDPEEALAAATSSTVLARQETVTVKHGAMTLETVTTPTGGTTNLSVELSVPQLAVLAVAVLLGPIVAFVSIFVILRKCGVPFFPMFRVEVTQPADQAASWDDGRFQVESFRMTTDHVGEFQGDGTAQQFDLGPSYEEERLSKEAQLNQQDQAVLQHVFQQNMQLREQIAAGE